jgi:hypothetical protein
MEMTFNDLVDEIQRLDKEQKEELKTLLENYLIEERREELYKNYLDAKKKVKEKKVKFSSDINELKMRLEE